MNSNHQIASPELPPAALEAETTPPQSAGVCPHRGHGNVARLPKAARDQINNAMLDGIPYARIIQSLGEQGKHLKPDHLYQWKKRGHKDWLVQQDWLAERRARRESAADLIEDCDTTQTNQSALHLGTLYIFEALRDLRAGSLDDKLGGDCAAFARLLNALSRASRETVLLQKYREACAKARAALQALRDPKRKKLNEEENRSLVLMVDDILGMPSDDDDPPETPLPESASTQPSLSASGGENSPQAGCSRFEPMNLSGRTTALPLPGGEGRGEGERSLVQTEVHGEG